MPVAPTTPWAPIEVRVCPGLRNLAALDLPMPSTISSTCANVTPCSRTQPYHRRIRSAFTGRGRRGIISGKASGSEDKVQRTALGILTSHFLLFLRSFDARATTVLDSLDRLTQGLGRLLCLRSAAYPSHADPARCATCIADIYLRNTWQTFNVLKSAGGTRVAPDRPIANARWTT